MGELQRLGLVVPLNGGCPCLVSGLLLTNCLEVSCKIWVSGRKGEVTPPDGLCCVTGPGRGGGEGWIAHPWAVLRLHCASQAENGAVSCQDKGVE